MESRSRTTSLCPFCLRPVEAERVEEDGAVFMEKHCPEHGILPKALLWRNDPIPYADWVRPGAVIRGPRQFLTESVDGCPYDCGICPNHKQDTCSVIIELTSRCNLKCPICFASANEAPQPDPEHPAVLQILEDLRNYGAPIPIQFTGGEPTLRDDLPQIVAAARKMGFDHIQVNTNGIRLAEEVDCGRALKEAGIATVFLQFDGVVDEAYRRLRGRDLLSIKLKAIERCAELKVGVILVPTLVRGVNLDQIGAIIRFAKQWIPTVKGVHFQPMTHLGRYPHPPRNEDRILLPDILRAIEEQTEGELRIENLVPPGCEESHCSFSSLSVLGEDGRLVPATRFEAARKEGGWRLEDSAEKSRRYVRQHWKFRESEPQPVRSKCCSPGCCNPLQPADGFERILSHSFCVSGMAFQDAWNIDLERLQRCCIQVARPGGRLVPFCAYYMTDAEGRRMIDIKGERRRASNR